MRILMWGDAPVPTGFGRIGLECARRFAWRGHQVTVVSMMYQGGPVNEPFYVWSAAPPRDLWLVTTDIVNNVRPDVLISMQDFPYHHTLYWGCKIDYSVMAWVWATPIDGTPVDEDWVRLVDCADGAMVISRFGVEAMRQAGKRVSLLHPGVDVREFRPAVPEERAALRKQAGLPEGAFVVAQFCVNQGRKAIPATVEGFAEFCRDKPEALLYLDMDAGSGAGWDIAKLVREVGLDPKRVVMKAQVVPRLPGLRERYCLCDVMSQLAHREGYGLPITEGMACGVVQVALDWCAPSEQLAEGRGCLVPKLKQPDGTDYMPRGTWGGARDAHPDMPAYINILNKLYSDKPWRENVAWTGYKWAIEQTWDKAADQLEAVVNEAVKKKRAVAQHVPGPAPVPKPPEPLPVARPDDGGQVNPMHGLPKPMITRHDETRKPDDQWGGVTGNPEGQELVIATRQNPPPQMSLEEQGAVIAAHQGEIDDAIAKYRQWMNPPQAQPLSPNPPDPKPDPKALVPLTEGEHPAPRPFEGLVK